MSRKMTVIELDGCEWPGLADHGEKTAEFMIKTAREYAAKLRRRAEEIEQAGDGDFRVRLVRGIHSSQLIRIVQEPQHD